MFVAIPSRLWRETERNLVFTNDSKDPSADYSISRQSVEIPFGRSTLIDDRKKAITAAKPGDIFIIEAKTGVHVKNRIIAVEVNPALYASGAPVFKRLLRHDEHLGTISWTCYEAIDLKKLPWLFELYIYDQAIK